MPRALWIGTWVFVAVGVLASAVRLVYPEDAIRRFEPVRDAIYTFVGTTDPFQSTRESEVLRMDSRFAVHAGMTRLHVIPGALFLALVPFQFMPSVRRRFLVIHRWSGRFLIVMAVVITVSAFFFGLGMPFGGTPEAVAIGLFGTAFVFALARAWVCIRRGRQDLHREWMIRAFALAIAISTVRVLAPLDLPLTLMGFRPGPLFAILVWLGWVSTVGAAELWIRRTRVTT